jgi:hypothetical protein
MTRRALFNRQVYQTSGWLKPFGGAENPSYFKWLLAATEFERAALMERQVAQEGQIDAGRTRKVIVNRVGMLIGLVVQFEERQGEVRRDGHVEIGFAHGRDNDGTVAGAARDLLPAHIQLRVQPVNRQRTIVRVLNIELNGEVLLQQISAAHLDADDGDVWPCEFGREHRAAAEETEDDGQ